MVDLTISTSTVELEDGSVAMLMETAGVIRSRHGKRFVIIPY